MDNYNLGLDNAVRLTIVIGFCIMNFIFLFGWTIWGIGFVFDRRRRRRSIKSDIEEQEFHLREIQYDHEMRIRNILLEHEYSRMLQQGSEMQPRQTNAADDEGSL